MPESSSHLLYLLRHAKSSWDDDTLADHDRPLAPRGHKAATAMARHLRKAGVRPALVLCSSARRARETYSALKPAGELVVERALYGASAAELVYRLRELPEEVPSVMVIGHNPTMQAVVVGLAEQDDGADNPHLEAAREKFPTTALATLRLSGPWSALGAGSCELVALMRPRDL